MASTFASAVYLRCAVVVLCVAAAAECVGDRKRPVAGAANVARGRPVAVAGSGDARVVTDGRIVSEAAAPGPESTSLATVQDAVVVDLGSLRPVGALLLQADAADVYFVELSVDGATWQVAWRVEPVTGASGLHTRRTVLY